MRTYQLTIRNRLAVGLLLLVGLGLMGALLAVGLALVIGLAAGAAVLGSGVLLYRALTGRRPALPRDAHSRPLDPSLEVFAQPRGLPEATKTEPPIKPES